VTGVSETPAPEQIAEIRTRWEDGYESMTGMHADVQTLLGALAAERERAERAEGDRDQWRFDHNIVEHWQERAAQAEAAVEQRDAVVERVVAVIATPDDEQVWENEAWRGVRRVAVVDVARLLAALDQPGNPEGGGL